MNRTALLSAAAVIATSMMATAEAKVNIDVQYPLAFIFDSVFAQLKADFEKQHPDITVTYRAPYKEYEDAAQTALRQSISGDLADVSMQAINLQRLFVDRKIAVDVSPFIAAEKGWKEQGYSDAMMALGNFAGKQYGMAFAVSTPIVYYNIDLVKKAGGDPDNLPKTWDEIITLANKISALDKDTFGVFHSWTITGNWMWQALVYSHGGAMLTPDEKKVAFNDANGQRAMAVMERLIKEAKMPDLAHEAARQAFFAGKMGIWTESTSLLRVADSSVGGKFQWKTGAFPVPGPNAKLPTGGNAALMFTKDPEKQKAAWEFMKFMTGPIGATYMVKGTGYLPPNALPADDPALLKPFYAEHPNHLTALKQAPYMTPWYAFPGENALKIISVIFDGLQTVADRSTPPQTALTNIAKDVQGLLPK